MICIARACIIRRSMQTSMVTDVYCSILYNSYIYTFSIFCCLPLIFNPRPTTFKFQVM